MSYNVPHSGSVFPGTRLSENVTIRTRSDITNTNYSLFSGTGVATVFIVGFTIPGTGIAEVVVYVDRLRMSAVTDYTVTAATGTITFTKAPKIDAYIKVIAVPAANTVASRGLTAVAAGTGAGTGGGSGAFRQGIFTLISGAGSVVANSTVTANSRIFVTSNQDGVGSIPGFLRITTRIPGVSFTVVSSGANDNSTVAYTISEPALAL